MTRINTNVSSLIAQNTLGRSNASLNQALTRLSTGLRINTGKDDPAGLIASENLRSDITSVKKAITNTDRANQVIATADSALGQVSSLLNDIRGLVTESANTGVAGPDQIDANQRQIDSSLEALNRIAQTTSFQGRKLLDGSLDFITSTTDSDFVKLSNLQIDQANLGSTGSVDVDINVSAVATQAQVNIANIPAAVAGVAATGTLALSNTVTQAVWNTTFGTAADLDLTAEAAGPAAGHLGNGFTGITIIDGAVAGSSYDANTGVLSVTVDITGGDNTVADLAAAINAGTDFNVTTNGGGGETITAGALTATASQTTLGQSAGAGTITVTADDTGTTANGVTVTLIEDNTITNNTAQAALNGSNIEVRVRGSVAYSAITSAIDSLSGYSAVLSGTSGNTSYIDTADTAPSAGTLAGGVTQSGGIAADLVIGLAGATGGEVLTFQAGTSITDIKKGIDAVSDATGVKATINGTTLELVSTSYGSNAFVDVKIIKEGTGDTPAGTFTTALGGVGAREEGTDIEATINGVAATGNGNNLTINTATLDLNTSVAAGFAGTISFTITGGGALFQLGPDVVSNQQARLGIGSVNTARLGGASGKLYQLGTGGSASLTSDKLDVAAAIVEEAINQVTSLRGRLGAFQRTSLETNKNALNDTLTNLTDAESAIRDADFASETAALTRAQILVQSGTTVLQIANSNPQNVLALLQR
jgi:flagellin